MNNPGNFAAALQTIMNGVGLVTQTGHATPPVGTVVIYNDGGTLKYMGSDGVPHTFGGGGGGGVENPMTANLDAGGYDISNINILTVAFSAYLPTSTTIGTFIPATLDNPATQTFSGSMVVAGQDFTLGNVVIDAGNIKIYGESVPTVGVSSTWALTQAFTSGIAMFGGTAGQWSAIADCDITTVVAAVNQILADQRTRGDRVT